MFDVVIQRVAVADAFQCQLGGKGEQFRQSGTRRAEPASGFLRQKCSQCLCGQLGNGDHRNLRSGRAHDPVWQVWTQWSSAILSLEQ